MGPAQRLAALQALALDPRFGAVVAEIEIIKNETADSASELACAAHHGTMAHAGGARFGLRILEGKIMAAANPKRETAEKGPEKKR